MFKGKPLHKCTLTMRRKMLIMAGIMTRANSGVLSTMTAMAATVERTMLIQSLYASGNLLSSASISVANLQYNRNRWYLSNYSNSVSSTPQKIIRHSH